jgi:GDP/UDP-N,N'-diacetylbacillosamine 2-epimerase (hydrolysing)
MRNYIMKNRKPYMHVVSNMPRADYLGLMKIADVLIGNSSSGILEAPSLKLPAVNIGNRQYGRMRGENVIDVPSYLAKDIAEGIHKALSPDFKKHAQNAKNPYGDGKSARRIVDILASVSIDERLLVKRITY